MIKGTNPEGAYLSRGKTVEQIKAEAQAQAMRDAAPLAVEFPMGIARDGLAHIRTQGDLLLDVSMSLSFLENVLRDISGNGYCAQLSSLLGLINTAVRSTQDKGEITQRQMESALQAAVAGQEEAHHAH